MILQKDVSHERLGALGPARGAPAPAQDPEDQRLAELRKCGTPMAAIKACSRAKWNGKLDEAIAVMRDILGPNDAAGMKLAFPGVAIPPDTPSTDEPEAKAAPRATFPDATAAMAALRQRFPNLRFCANRSKGQAFEQGWQHELRPGNPDEWPARWRGALEFCVVPSTARLFLVDVDSAFDDADDPDAQRPATKDEAVELVKALGGAPYMYESTRGKNSWHILYADTANGGRDWCQLKGAPAKGFASSNGLLWKTADGATLKFDTRGGGVYRDGPNAGKICGCRVDANKRRLGKLLAALDHGVTPIEHPEVLVGAYAAKGKWGKTIAKTAKGGAHELILERTRRMVGLTGDDLAEQIDALAAEVAAERATRKNSAGLSTELDTAKAEIERAHNGAVAFAEATAATRETREEVASDTTTQLTFASEFVMLADGRWLHDDDAKEWWCWNPKRRLWRERTHKARRMMRDIIRRQTSGNPRSEDKWQQSSHINGALTVASDDAHCSRMDDFNADPMLAGLPGGLALELETGKTRPAKRKDRLTMTLGAIPCEGDAPTFMKFLRFAFEDDDDTDLMIENVLWFIGDALRGKVNESDGHGFLFLKGAPGTGKSTLTNVIHALLGDYAVNVSSERVTGTRQEHLQWLMRVAGKRLVVVAEVPPAPLKCEIVNALSAGDPIEANAMRQGSVDFRPVCHLLLNGNHAPHISSPGTFRRMRLIPMERIPTEEDDTLERRIVGEEGGSILRMALEARAKRAKPTWGAGVKAAVRTYEIENDKVATWMDECCVIDPGKTVWAATAFANFQNWWTTTGHQHSATMQYFGAKLRDKGFKKDRSAPTPGATRQWYYKGFALEENEF